MEITEKIDVSYFIWNDVSDELIGKINRKTKSESITLLLDRLYMILYTEIVRKIRTREIT